MLNMSLTIDASFGFTTVAKVDPSAEARTMLKTIHAELPDILEQVQRYYKKIYRYNSHCIMIISNPNTSDEPTGTESERLSWIVEI
jgi:hypothetical protein